MLTLLSHLGTRAVTATVVVTLEAISHKTIAVAMLRIYPMALEETVVAV